MNLTLDHEKMLMLLLKGAWFDSVTITEDIAKELEAQDPNGEVLHIERPPYGAIFRNLWTKEGWANEERRRLYILSIKEPAEDHWYPKEQPKPKPRTKKEVEKELQEAACNNNIELMQQLVAELSKL